MLRRRHEPEPQTRVGHCCGCGADDALYKIPNIPRYRCARCFKAETGFHHYLTPASVISRLQTEKHA